MAIIDNQVYSRIFTALSAATTRIVNGETIFDGLIWTSERWWATRDETRSDSKRLGQCKHL